MSYAMINPSELTVFITGSSAGIGLATARRFHELGAKIILAGRRQKRLVRIREEIGEDRVCVLPLDVRDRQAMQEAIEALPPMFSDVNVLVNNAGVALGTELVLEADLNKWDTVIETNIKGLVQCTRMLLPKMCENGRAHIINIGSVSGTYPYAGGNVYAASKAFVHQFSLGLRSDLLGRNVRVTVIEPGRVQNTEVSLVRFEGDAKKAAEPYQGFQPLNPEDIAESVVWTATLPAHVNINVLEVMPLAQAFNPLKIQKTD